MESKFKLLSPFEEVDRIIIVRKGLGYVISKVHYRFLPKICKNPLIKKLITPFVIMEEVKKTQSEVQPGISSCASIWPGIHSFHVHRDSLYLGTNWIGC